MMYYAVKNNFHEICMRKFLYNVKWKEQLKVVYTVWSYLIHELSKLITELSNLYIWKHARWFYLEDPQASQPLIKMNELNLFFLHSQICFFFHPLPPQIMASTIHPATAAKILSLSHSWSPMLNQWLYPALSNQNLQFPLACFPPLLTRNSLKFYTPFRYLV